MSSEGREVSKEKWEITIDVMLVIGKYFEENEDYVNVMRVSKKYRDLVSMYHFNPIEDCSLFENMESQYFYSKPKDKSWLTTIMGYFGHGGKKSGMHQYVYWYPVDYEVFKNKKENEIFKIVELNRKETDHKREYPLLIENGKCVVPEGVTSIGRHCFNECSSLTNIQLPSSLINIGNGAFSESNITTITIPDGVTSIGNDCFYECSTLTSVQLSSLLMELGD